MKFLKMIFIIGCIPLLLGDVFIVLNFALGNIIPAPLVLTMVCLGLIGILCGIAYCRPQKSNEEKK